MLACLVLATLGRNFTTILRQGYDALATRGHPVADGDLDPFSFYASTRALSGARALIPASASYTVVVGKTTPPSSELPGPDLLLDPVTLKVAFELWLMPRTYVPLSRAQWVVAYDTPPAALGVKVAQSFQLGPDATVVQVAGR